MKEHASIGAKMLEGAEKSQLSRWEESSHMSTTRGMMVWGIQGGLREMP